MNELLLSLIRAFLVGGAICVLVQLLIDKTRLTPARILVLLVVSGVVLDALGLFESMKEFAGAGVTTPLCGFGALIARGVRKAINEKGLLGALTGGLTAAAGGTSAAIVFGYLAALCTRGRPKR